MGRVLKKISDMSQTELDLLRLNVLRNLPAIAVEFDPGPPDAGLASGAGNLIFLADGCAHEAVIEQIEVLAQALRALINSILPIND